MEELSLQCDGPKSQRSLRPSQGATLQPLVGGGIPPPTQSDGSSPSSGSNCGDVDDKDDPSKGAKEEGRRRAAAAFRFVPGRLRRVLREGIAGLEADFRDQWGADIDAQGHDGEQHRRVMGLGGPEAVLWRASTQQQAGHSHVHHHLHHHPHRCRCSMRLSELLVPASALAARRAATRIGNHILPTTATTATASVMGGVCADASEGGGDGVANRRRPLTLPIHPCEAHALVASLPARLQCASWTPFFDTAVDGFSLTHFLRCAEEFAAEHHQQGQQPLCGASVMLMEVIPRAKEEQVRNHRARRQVPVQEQQQRLLRKVSSGGGSGLFPPRLPEGALAAGSPLAASGSVCSVTVSPLTSAPSSLLPTPQALAGTPVAFGLPPSGQQSNSPPPQHRQAGGPPAPGSPPSSSTAAVDSTPGTTIIGVFSPVMPTAAHGHHRFFGTRETMVFSFRAITDDPTVDKEEALKKGDEGEGYRESTPALSRSAVPPPLPPVAATSASDTNAHKATSSTDHNHSQPQHSELPHRRRFTRYHWATGQNEEFMLCGPDFFGVGGGRDGAAIFVDSNLEYGSSSTHCETFGSGALSLPVPPHPLPLPVSTHPAGTASNPSHSHGHGHHHGRGGAALRHDEFYIVRMQWFAIDDRTFRTLHGPKIEPCECGGRVGDHSCQGV